MQDQELVIIIGAVGFTCVLLMHLWVWYYVSTIPSMETASDFLHHQRNIQRNRNPTTPTHFPENIEMQFRHASQDTEEIV
jgi:hypothetical protein